MDLTRVCIVYMEQWQKSWLVGPTVGDGKGLTESERT